MWLNYDRVVQEEKHGLKKRSLMHNMRVYI